MDEGKDVHLKKKYKEGRKEKRRKHSGEEGM